MHLEYGSYHLSKEQSYTVEYFSYLYLHMSFLLVFKYFNHKKRLHPDDIISPHSESEVGREVDLQGVGVSTGESPL